MLFWQLTKEQSSLVNKIKDICCAADVFLYEFFLFENVNT